MVLTPDQVFADDFGMDPNSGQLPAYAPDPQPEYELVTSSVRQEEPIDILTNNEELHKKIVSFLTQKIKLAEDEMERFYNRWESNEMKLQAYIHLPEREQELKQQNLDGEIPNATKIVVPFAYAAQSTIVTYLLHTFANRKPIFQVGSYKGEAQAASTNMETVLQFQADRTRIVKDLWKVFNDIGTYGLGVLTVQWEEIFRARTRRERGPGLGGAFTDESSSQVEELIYEGNTVDSIDPFMFLPDPRVAMTDVAEEGEFCFWRSSVSRMRLLRDADYTGVDKIKQNTPVERYPRSVRNRLARGSNVGEQSSRFRGGGSSAKFDHDFVWIDQGSIWIIPKDLKLGDSEDPELWFFTMANKERIIEALPYTADHNTHPVAVMEPYGFGYGFGQPGPADFVGPIQDMLSWLLNSHIDNVRTSLNNMFVADPHRIVLSDLKHPQPGKVIRLRRNALGTDVRTALYQLPVQDITRGHMADAEMMMSLGQMLLAINENIMGQPQSGGRKTASEVRISGQSAVSRLAMIARVISGQGISRVAEMMASNTLQYLSDDFYLQITGQDGAEHNIRAPDLDGSFLFPVHDGTLPLDKVALMEVWKEIFMAIAQNDVLAQQFDVAAIFEHVAELGGASDIERFKRKVPPQVPAQVDVRPDAEVEDMVGAGKLAPLAQAFGGGA